LTNIVNQPTLGGGFKHYAGLLPAVLGGGDPHHASVKIFGVTAANAAAIFRGDTVVAASASIGVQGGQDFPFNIGAPGGTVIGNGGGTLLGNQSLAPNVSRWVPGDNTSLIVGCVVGFGPITLYQAKNGFQYIPALTQAWLYVETDPALEMQITMPTVPNPVFNLELFNGVDVKANAGFQSTRFGVSGVSLDPATIANTSTLPLRILNSSEQIGNDPTSVGFVAKVKYNVTRHAFGTGALLAD